MTDVNRAHLVERVQHSESLRRTNSFLYRVFQLSVLFTSGTGLQLRSVSLSPSLSVSCNIFIIRTEECEFESQFEL